jgi:hypothetical protein
VKKHVGGPFRRAVKVKKSPQLKTKTFERVDATGKEGLELTIEQISMYIQTRAYYIWQQLGKPDGQDLDIWMKAEKEIMAELNK